MFTRSNSLELQEWKKCLWWPHGEHFRDLWNFSPKSLLERLKHDHIWEKTTVSKAAIVKCFFAESWFWNKTDLTLMINEVVGQNTCVYQRSTNTLPATPLGTRSEPSSWPWLARGWSGGIRTSTAGILAVLVKQLINIGDDFPCRPQESIRSIHINQPPSFTIRSCWFAIYSITCLLILWTFILMLSTEWLVYWYYGFTNPDFNGHMPIMRCWYPHRPSQQLTPASWRSVMPSLIIVGSRVTSMVATNI